ncbi:hypothetical protein [Ornithinicoccus hortensis]|nr:hypothetical protein [Ornithinicoccus hortensis]
MTFPEPPPPGWDSMGRPRRSRAPAGLAMVLLFALVGVLLLNPLLISDALERVGLGGASRLRPAPETSSSATAYAFVDTQPGTGTPVSYDPCREIEVAINPDGAPGDHEELVRTSLERTSEATGFVFVLVGTTPDRERGIRTRDQPVLVMWADEEEVSELEGRIAGIGGSTVQQAPNGFKQFVSGVVVLDVDAFEDMREPAVRQAIVDHEFGHLVGLDHVDDESQLMHAEGARNLTYGTGDLAGLARLGNVACG